MPLRTFSLSAYQTWQRCEQRYYYQYIRKLRPLVKEAAPQRGIIIHDYLAGYYAALRDGSDARAAHVWGLHRLKEYERTIKQAVTTLWSIGREEEAAEYGALLDEILSICERYFEVHGREDAETYRVETVEETIRFPIVEGIMSISVLDLVTIDRDLGRRNLWDHKTTGTIPNSKTRLRDLQTLLYVTALNITQGRTVDFVHWNYIRTKAPTKPSLLARGGMSRDKRSDTTWPVYLAALREAGLNEAAYQDMRDHLIDRELNNFFPRYEQLLIATPDVLLRDYAVEARRARNAVHLWELGAAQPVRSIRWDCDQCPFWSICEAAIVGGDEEDVIRLRFRTGREEAA